MKIAKGVEKEKLEHCRDVLRGAEGECGALKIENRQLKTKIKELTLNWLWENAKDSR